MIGPTDAMCCLNNREIEESYLENKTGSIEFSTSSHKYKLIFDKMCQKNIRFGTERKVTRRPEFVSRKMVMELKENKV